MVLCIECGSPVKSLWTQYGPGNLRLTQCRRCHHFADKYIENDNIIVFLDLVLHKRPVYRHMLFNGRIVFDDDGLNPNVIRMGILLILFDVFEMWFHIELVYGNDHFPPPGVSVVRQYLWLLMLAFLTEVLRHALVRLAIWLWVWRPAPAAAAGAAAAATDAVVPAGSAARYAPLTNDAWLEGADPPPPYLDPATRRSAARRASRRFDAIAVATAAAAAATPAMAAASPYASAPAHGQTRGTTSRTASGLVAHPLRPASCAIPAERLWTAPPRGSLRDREPPPPGSRSSGSRSSGFRGGREHGNLDRGVDDDDDGATEDAPSSGAAYPFRTQESLSASPLDSAASGPPESAAAPHPPHQRRPTIRIDIASAGVRAGAPEGPSSSASALASADAESPSAAATTAATHPSEPPHHGRPARPETGVRTAGEGLRHRRHRGWPSAQARRVSLASSLSPSASYEHKHEHEHEQDGEHGAAVPPVLPRAVTPSPSPSPPPRDGSALHNGPNPYLATHLVSMALIISSFGKLLLIIMVIWNYHELVNAWFVHAFVVGSNTEALSVLLGISWLETLPIILAGASSTWIVRGIGSYWDPTLRVLIDGLVPILTV